MPTASHCLTPLFYRDIPLPLVTSGCENSGNLRELALNRMKDFGAECRDVRFREVGVRVILCCQPFINELTCAVPPTPSYTAPFRYMKYTTKSARSL